MDEKEMRTAVIRWLTCLVHVCPESNVWMVSDALGLRSPGELRSMAQRMIRELAERGE